jgi:hypothetical protein
MSVFAEQLLEKSNCLKLTHDSDGNIETLEWSTGSSIDINDGKNKRKFVENEDSLHENALKKQK